MISDPVLPGFVTETTSCAAPVVEDAALSRAIESVIAVNGAIVNPPFAAPP
jgi:hypothetical protein